ncbi:MAG: folate-binding protein [Lysobacteraceae bacterium]
MLRIDGTDAIDFAQSQFANDVRALSVNTWQWNAWLNARGRVRALFMLLRSGEQELRLVSADAPAEALADELKRMVFRRKLSLSVDSAGGFQGRFLADTAPASSMHPFLSEGEQQWRGHMDDASGREWRIAPSAPTSATTTDFSLAWRIADLRCGVVHLPPQGSDLTAHQLGLHRLPALSLSKGCYPGQEIVARTHYLGKSHRQLTRVGSSSPLHDGASLRVDGRETALLMNAIQISPDHWEALAALPDAGEDSESMLTSADGAPVQRLPFITPD